MRVYGLKFRVEDLAVAMLVCGASGGRVLWGSQHLGT